jgi:hypothetical protein
MIDALEPFFGHANLILDVWLKENRRTAWAPYHTAINCDGNGCASATALS